MYSVGIFFCLFCNFYGSKLTHTQNREKQRNSLMLTFS
jgi:hypothetical protein